MTQDRSESLSADLTHGDGNVVRLLGHAYRPEALPPGLLERVRARLLVVAGETARQRRGEVAAPRSGRHTRSRRLARLGGLAAMLGVLSLGLSFLTGPGKGFIDNPTRLLPERVGFPSDALSGVPLPPAPGPRSHLVRGRLTASPRPPLRRGTVLVPGTTVSTGGERRRFLTPDGSVLSLNQNTTLVEEAVRSFTLQSGEVLVEAAPGGPLTVRTPGREVTALGTRFVVEANAEGTGVKVLQGRVTVSGLDEPLVAGQEVGPHEVRAVPAPRASHVLDWTRDLADIREASLVPPSPYAGGSLVALDANRRPTDLSLRKYHLDVYVEDGFARTTIDATYFNALSARVEGTFYFPLPPDASLSRLAMYVDGTRMEGGMVERDYGRAVFDSIVSRQRDPALLDWVDGRLFKMRVFPLEGRQEKRILLSYTQKLPALYGKWTYRFPAGHSLDKIGDWSFHARVKGGGDMSWRCPSHDLVAGRVAGDLLLEGCATEIRPERDVVLELTQRSDAPVSGEVVWFSGAEQDGARYLMVRYRPDLPGKARRERRDWVFLFESSADRTSLLSRAQVEVVRNILVRAEAGDTFAIVTADCQAQAFAPRPVLMTSGNVERAVAFLEEIHLVGALDLDRALSETGRFLGGAANPYLVHVGTAQAALGVKRPEELVRRLPLGTHYVGVGVGVPDAPAFMKLAADQTGGYCTTINPDEPVAWRSFDLLATLDTPRLVGAQVTDPAGQAGFLSPIRFTAQGEEIWAVARLDGVPYPAEVAITGNLDGRPFRRVLKVGSVRPGADYLPRTWARLEIERLLTEDPTKDNRDRVVALSKAMYVMTPYTSLLVLENEEMYRQYKVDRGSKDHWAPYPCPEKMPVVNEPLPGDEAEILAVTDIGLDSLQIIELEPPGPEQLFYLSPEAGFMNRIGLQAKDAVLSLAPQVLKPFARPDPRKQQSHTLAKAQEIGPRSFQSRKPVRPLSSRDKVLIGLRIGQLEKELEKVYGALPTWADRKALARRLELLLSAYGLRAEGTSDMNPALAAELTARVILVADRVRSLVGNDPSTCLLAGHALWNLGAVELGWAYLSSPQAGGKARASDWLELARVEHRAGHWDYADRALAEAGAINPTDPTILWERAWNLRHAGQREQARAFFGTIVSGTWDKRYSPLQVESRKMILQR